MVMSATTIIARNGNLFTGFEANIIAVRTGGVAAGEV
jgi:tetrahydromethanopterin S-methyltransferase subunit F